MIVYLLVATLTFAALYALDKGLTRLFRSRQQHQSGTAVRLKKHYGIMSVALMVLGGLGIAAYFTNKTLILLLGGLLVLPMGAVLGIYYMTHGIFYDGESFLYVSFGRHSEEYRYADIRGQKLYVLQGGSYLVDLYMENGKSVSVQTSMEGALEFLDKAAHARMRQLGLNSHECSWFDGEHGQWFPDVED